MSDIRAYANGDHAFVVCRLDGAIIDCLGFAVYRRDDGDDGDGQPLDNWIGFAGDTADPGTHKPTTTWPVQRLSWADLQVERGRSYQWRFVPMIGTPTALAPDTDHATPWSEAVTISPECEAPMSAHFNRGVLDSQWIARQFPSSENPKDAVEDALKEPGSSVRAFLSGELRPTLLALLDGVLAGTGHIYAALFELDDPELLDRLTRLGARAHVVLANGAHTTGKPDENLTARAELNGAHCEVHDRLVTGSHLAHNKFLLWTDGSTPAAAPADTDGPGGGH